MRVSVILPTYNRSESLLASIKSVLAQSYEDYELIVVDDGSSEDIEGIVRSIGDARISYVRRARNGGAAAARNTGLSLAKGEYVAFQDSDDIWLPGKLKRQVELLSRCPSHIGAVLGAKIIYGRDNARNYGPARIAYAPEPEGRLRPDEDQLGHLLAENRISLQNSLFRKNCLPDLHWFDTCAKANEDWEFAVRLAQHTVIYEDIEPVVLGFISPDSISRNRRKEIIGLLRILRKNRDVLRGRNRQRSLMLIDVGRYFYTAGRKKTAARFLAAGLATYPLHIRVVGSALVAKILGRRKRPAVAERTQPEEPGFAAQHRLLKAGGGVR